ncbi:MAG: hypothetical protein EGR92_03995 [[Eubacterium] rectale]|nr:hypothetical protein [Agathobacter rectalis]
MLALPLPPSKSRLILYVPSGSSFPSLLDTLASVSAGVAFETFTLWSYHLPFVPISARSNSSSKTGTGISNALTSSVVPSP